jgi:hypothetical protein
VAEIDEVKPTYPTRPTRRVEKEKQRREPDDTGTRRPPARREPEGGKDDTGHVDEYA